jgi:2-haloacid dehalogenase
MNSTAAVERTLAPPDTVIFDLGGVLIDWNPRHLYRKLFNDEDAMERFLADVCNGPWNEQQDAGRDWGDATTELCAVFPAQEAMIRAYRARWDEMLGGPIYGTVAIVDTLRERGVPLYALTNWAHDTFAIARQRYAFLDAFKDIAVSGTERLIKPDPAFFQLLLTRSGIDPARAVYVDDTARHVTAAKALGMRALLFRDTATLRYDLAALGLLEPIARGATA